MLEDGKSPQCTEYVSDTW